jgi:dCMP deaminase
LARDPLATARPGWDEYYVSIALAVAARSNCCRRRVGALIVVQKAIIATGYNGTPIGVRNCADGGCPRCLSDAAPGEGYDACPCVHASRTRSCCAPRQRHRCRDFHDLRPPLRCAKEAIQAGIREIVYQQPYAYAKVEEVYGRLIAEPASFRQYPAGLTKARADQARGLRGPDLRSSTASRVVAEGAAASRFRR